jgi:hypothetical protein
MRLALSLHRQGQFDLSEHVFHIARVKQDDADRPSPDAARHHRDAQRQRFAHRNRIPILERGPEKHVASQHQCQASIMIYVAEQKDVFLETRIPD